MLVNNDACEKFSLGGAIVAFVMTLTGVAGPHWMYVTGLRNSNNMGNFSVRLGLWLKCTYPPDVEECQYHPFFEVLGMYRLSRVCATLSTGLCLCAAIGTITKTFVSRHVRMRDIGIACTFAGGLGMATISVFLCKVDDLVEIPNSKKSVTYGWSFFIFSVGALIATFTAYVVFLTYPDAGRTLSRFAVPEYFILDSAMLRSGTFPPGTYAVQCDYDPTKQPEMVPYATSVMLPDDQGGCDPKKLAEPVAVQRKYA